MTDETEERMTYADACIRDDSTECDCSACTGNQLAWERVQGWHERDAADAAEAARDPDDLEERFETGDLGGGDA
jgi:hypothetical protein